MHGATGFRGRKRANKSTGRSEGYWRYEMSSTSWYQLLTQKRTRVLCIAEMCQMVTVWIGGCGSRPEDFGSLSRVPAVIGARMPCGACR
eukprot:6157812-Pleurochrysis_carterae.AAC.11